MGMSSQPVPPNDTKPRLPLGVGGREVRRGGQELDPAHRRRALPPLSQLHRMVRYLKSKK